MEEEDGNVAYTPDEAVPVFCTDEWAKQRMEQVPRLVPVQHSLTRGLGENKFENVSQGTS